MRIIREDPGPQLTGRARFQPCLRQAGLTKRAAPRISFILRREPIVPTIRSRRGRLERWEAGSGEVKTPPFRKCPLAPRIIRANGAPTSRRA